MLKNPTFLELTPQTGYNGKVLPKLIKCTSALKLQLSIAIINSEGCIYLFWKNLNCQNFLFLIIFVSINLTKNKKLALRISRFLKTILTKLSRYLNQGLLTHLWYLHFSKKNFHSPQSHDPSQNILDHWNLPLHFLIFILHMNMKKLYLPIEACVSTTWDLYMTFFLLWINRWRCCTFSSIHIFF